MIELAKDRITLDDLDSAGRGLECRQCSCRHFETYKTEPLTIGVIRRRKRCRNCGWTTVTIERLRDDAS